MAKLRLDLYDKRFAIYENTLTFYQALERMTDEERTAVAGALKFGCRGELPEGVHISLDYLSRMTRMPQVELMEALAAVRSLNVYALMFLVDQAVNRRSSGTITKPYIYLRVSPAILQQSRVGRYSVKRP